MANKDVIDRVIIKEGKGERAKEFFEELEKEKTRKKTREKSTKKRVEKEKKKVTQQKKDRKQRAKDFLKKLDEEKARAPKPKKKEKPKEPVSPIYRERGIKSPKIPTPHLHAQDDSAPKLHSALRNGYTHARWHLNPEHDYEAENQVCVGLDGQEFLIEDLITGINYNAPIYETSHVGCKCSLELYNPEKPELEPYYINSGGRWANTKWWNVKYGDDMRVTKTPKPSGDLPDPRGGEKKPDFKPKKRPKQDFDKILQEKIKEAQDANKKSPR